MDIKKRFLQFERYPWYRVWTFKTLQGVATFWTLFFFLKLAISISFKTLYQLEIMKQLDDIYSGNIFKWTTLSLNRPIFLSSNYIPDWEESMRTYIHDWYLMHLMQQQEHYYLTVPTPQSTVRLHWSIDCIS